ncbi:carbamate kinase [Clostridium senegalense]|uniref:Carbamate kinase n=1 Tax=Clostridium senegalense TaxID=1465809 RepID=A0A6M0H4X6_9CLOT|nr:carbamate kinase [Clostridium senegalense]NEU04632.1 carbamate kinase [Clostridium senegalense]
MGNKIVIALGGNALGNNCKEQMEAVKYTSNSIVDLIAEGNEIVIAHGNGPQVGMINLAMESREMPLPECGAMSQGYIGYHLQKAIREEFRNRGIDKDVVSIITQSLIDKNDKAFKNPTKPIGSFYSKEEALELERKKGYTMLEDAGRGYRRVVPSPLPTDIVEKKVIKSLIKDGHVVITVGGGGIPVVEENGALVGIPAVIDKDFASEKLAEIIDADYLIILTAVDKVAINYGKSNERWLDQLSIEETKKYIEEGHFAPGSMLPKVEAALKFANSKKGRKALITSLEKAKDGIKGNTGTLISDK